MHLVPTVPRSSPDQCELRQIRNRDNYGFLIEVPQRPQRGSEQLGEGQHKRSEKERSCQAGRQDIRSNGCN